MLFAENQEQSESYTFKEMLLQADKSYLIIDMIKEAEAHKTRSHFTPMKNSEVNNKHKNKYGKLKTILSICYFNSKRFPYGRLMKHKPRLFSYGGIQQWEVNE